MHRPPRLRQRLGQGVVGLARLGEHGARVRGSCHVDGGHERALPEQVLARRRLGNLVRKVLELQDGVRNDKHQPAEHRQDLRRAQPDVLQHH
jgi:hypothetical protein